MRYLFPRNFSQKTLTCKQTIPVKRQRIKLKRSHSDATQNCFVWRNEDESLYYDTHEIVRVKIESEEWCDQSPVGPSKADDVAEERQSPYSLQGSMVDPGLGPIIWWQEEWNRLESWYLAVFQPFISFISGLVFASCGVWAGWLESRSFRGSRIRQIPWG